MKVYDAASIRNIAIVGHGGSGKTQLVSALLLAAVVLHHLRGEGDFDMLLGGHSWPDVSAMAPLLPLFDAGKMAVVLNVGTLVRPTTKAQYQANSVALPPKLFSHNDQQSYWQASSAEGATSGWGGRIGDLLQSGNGSAALTCISASGNAVYLSGRSSIQYVTGTNGPTPLINNASTLYGSSAAASALRSLMGGARTHLIENEHAAISKRALDLYAQVNGALGSAPASNFPSCTRPCGDAP